MTNDADNHSTPEPTRQPEPKNHTKPKRKTRKEILRDVEAKAKKKYEPRHLRPEIEDVIAGIKRIKSVHDASDTIPMIGGQDFDRLVDHIKESGLLHPVQIDADGRLLDGRSRLMALHVAGIKITDDMIVQTDADPMAVAKANLARRNLGEETIARTLDQLKMYAADRLEEEERNGRARKRVGGRKGGQAKANKGSNDAKLASESPASQKRAPSSLARISKETGVSQRDLKKSSALKKKNPELAQRVRDGEMTCDEACSEAGIVDSPKKRSAREKPDKPENSTNIDTEKSPQVILDDGPIVVAFRSVRVIGQIFKDAWQVSAHDAANVEALDAKGKTDAIDKAKDMAKTIVARLDAEAEAEADDD